MKYGRVNKKNKRRVKQEKMRNRRLVKKYPWLLPRNVWYDTVPDDYDYSYTAWGSSEGWDKAFGKMFMKELGEAIAEAGLQNRYRILQMKSKYGGIRLYDNGATEKIHNIISKYSYLSENVCEICGKPDVVMINNFGWWTPECYHCYRKDWKNYEKRRLEHDKDYVQASEETIRQSYDENINKDDDCRMADTYTIRSWVNGETVDTVYDISETANKIRANYQRRKAKRERQRK